MPLVKRRKRRAPRLPRPPNLNSLESRYATNIRLLIKPMEELIETELFPALGRLESLRTDDDTEIVRQSFEAIRERYSKQVPEREVVQTAEDAARRINQKQAEYHGKVIESVLGVNPVQMEPWLQDDISSFVRENASLIKTLPGEALADVEQMVFREMRRGLSPKEMRAKIKEEFDVSYGRAKVIARDQVSKFNGRLTQQRQVNSGITRYTWQTSGDSRVRSSHSHLNGKIFSWDDPPVTVTSGSRAGERNHPGQDIQCFDGQVAVSNYAGINRIFRRWYSGEFTSFVSSTGKALRCTSNHPVLTDRGWVAAKHLNIGDQLFSVRQQCPGILDGNAHQGVSLEDLFSALSLVSAVESSRVFGRQFHGDNVVDQEVNIVNIHTLLSDERDVIFFQKLREFFFADTLEAALSGLSDLRHLFLKGEGFLNVGTGYSCGLSEFFSFLLTQASHSQLGALRNAASRDTHRFEPFLDNLMTNAKAVGDRFQALPVGVPTRYLGIAYRLSIVCRAVMPNQIVPYRSDFLAEIIGIDTKLSGNFTQIHSAFIKPDGFVDHVSRYFDSCHVYTLETQNGWFDAEDIIVQNCRCNAIPVIEDLL